MLKTIASDMNFESTDIAHSGIILTYPEQTMEAMLAEADMALRLAQQKGLNAYHIYDEHKEAMTVYGSAQWNDIIMDAIKKNSLELHFQRVTNSQSAIQQKEAMVRLHQDEQLLSAGVFIPMAEHLGIAHLIDQWVIRRIFDNYLQDSDSVYSINLSQNSLKDPAFPSFRAE